MEEDKKEETPTEQMKKFKESLKKKEFSDALKFYEKAFSIKPDQQDGTKEKISKKILLSIQPSLYNEFEEKCKKNYKTVSETMRELILKYVKEKNE